MARRNAGIDLLRCILVYGICAYHAFFVCGHASGSEARLWTWAVPGFAFVSGYFGVRYNFTKLLRILLTGCMCAAVSALLGGAYREALFGYWYLYAYVLLMILSPLINKGLASIHNSRDYKPLWGVAVLAIWSWLTECFLTRMYVPRVSGMGMLSFASVFVAYVLGWGYREFPHVASLAKRMWWLLIVMLPFMFVLGHYTSPFTLVFVVVLFAVFEDRHFSPGLSWFVSKVSAAGFAVYLLHTNGPAFHLMRQGIELGMAQGVPRWIALLGVALMVFISGVVLYWIVTLPILQLLKMRQS